MARKSKNKKPILYPVVFMIVIAAVFTTALASLNAVTIDLVETQEAVKNQRSILYVFGQDVPEGLEEVQTSFEALVTEETIKEISYYVATENDEIIGYAFPFQGSGLWGTIWGYVAITPDFSEIIGVDFIKHAETPGLGGRISEQWYRDQFRGIRIEEDMGDIIIYRPSSGGNADAITGATLTSNAVRNMINDQLQELLDEVKGDI